MARNFKITGVCIVGGGNAAHTFLALLPHVGTPNVRLYTAFEEEAQKISAGLEKDGGYISAEFASHLHPSGIIRGKPTCITTDPAEALDGVNVILMPVPGFAYESVFNTFKPHLQPGTMICVTPGQGGADWVARRSLGKELLDQLTLFALIPMPFNCRITEYGHQVHVQAFNSHFLVAATNTAHAEECISIGHQLCQVGHEHEVTVTSIGHMITASLLPVNPGIHPQRLYSMLHHYKEGDVLPTNPLFYEEMTEEAVKLMEQTSDELQEIAKKLTADLNLPFHLLTILEAEQLTWPDGPNKAPMDLLTIFRTSTDYKGFRSPFIPVDNGFKPDFSNRYFTEDIPGGLCLYKGVAELLGIATPTIDRLIQWAQAHMGKEYVTPDHRLAGRNVPETASPQAFGINTTAGLV